LVPVMPERCGCAEADDATTDDGDVLPLDAHG
jgi:hypothetical protein